MSNSVDTIFVFLELHDKKNETLIVKQSDAFPIDSFSILLFEKQLQEQ